MLDLVQAQDQGPDLPAPGVPAVGLWDVPDRREGRSLIEDQAQSECIVGVDQKRQLLVSRKWVEIDAAELLDVEVQVLWVLRMLLVFCFLFFFIFSFLIF